MSSSPPDPLRRRTRRPRAQREAEILAAARSVFAEHGFAGPRIAWLWANGRHERTLGATYEPGAGAS